MREPPALRVLYGGTFDPVHLGHVAVACAARDALDATIAFMPAADPPHRAPPGAAAAERAAMLELAVAGEPGLAETVAGRIAASADELRSAPAGRVLHLRQPLFPHSASEVRARIAAGLPWEALVPAPVAAYVRAHRLYGANPAPGSA